MDVRIGFGYDIHRFDENGKRFVLAGIEIPGRKIKAHSDGDCLYHSLSNAILSALGLEDIGTYFPDNQKDTEDVNSQDILSFSLAQMVQKGYEISNIVIDVQLQSIKLKDYKEEMKKHLSEVIGIDSTRIAIHANTKENLDAVGEDKAVVVYSNVCLIKM